MNLNTLFLLVLPGAATVAEAQLELRDACPGAVYTIRPFRTAYSTISAVL